MLGTSSSVSILYTTVISVGSWPAHATAAAQSYMAFSMLILRAFLGGREGVGELKEKAFQSADVSIPGGVRSGAQVCACPSGHWQGCLHVFLGSQPLCGRESGPLLGLSVDLPRAGGKTCILPLCP